MRRLILLRHAKSDHPPNVADRDRPLAGRGREQAPLIGRYLASESILPDLALVSPAKRTQETWMLVSAAFAETVARRDEPRLYAANAEAMIGVAAEAPEKARTLLLCGHNPGTHEAALALAGHGDRYALARLRQGFPTCAIAVLDFAVESWRDIEAHGARLDRFITPKSLGGEDSN